MVAIAANHALQPRASRSGVARCDASHAGMIHSQASGVQCDVGSRAGLLEWENREVEQVSWTLSPTRVIADN
jgi:hypothetical protein